MPVSHKSLQASINVLSDSEKKALGTSSFSSDGEPVLISLNENYLVNKLIGAGSDLDNPLAWKKVTIAFAPPSGNQHKHFTFRRRNGTFKSYSSWSTISTIGTWTLSKAIIVSEMGTYKSLDNSEFTSNDNITVS